MKIRPYRQMVYIHARIAQSAGAVEYTDCFFADGQDPSPTSVLYMTLNNLMMNSPVMLELWGIQSTPSFPSSLSPLWPGVGVAPDRVLSMGQIELNCVLMLNWIAWNRMFFLHLNFVLILNWIIWNGYLFVC